MSESIRAGCPGRSAGLAGDGGHPVEVVGEDSQAGPGLGAVEVAQAGATESESALEVAIILRVLTRYWSPREGTRLGGLESEPS